MKLNDIYNFIDYRGATPTKITNGIPLVTAKMSNLDILIIQFDDYISRRKSFTRIGSNVAFQKR
ncbi:MAG: hypothetical protein ACLT9J_00010 [Agathobacter rectalis]